MRAFLASNGYRIAQTTLDFEDYLWNSAHARCWTKNDAESLAWLRESYRTAAREFIALADRENSRAVFGRDIHHVMLLHLGSFSSHILPDLFEILDEEGFEIVTLEEAQNDPAYDYDPDVAERARRHARRARHEGEEHSLARQRATKAARPPANHLRVSN